MPAPKRRSGPQREAVAIIALRTASFLPLQSLLLFAFVENVAFFEVQQERAFPANYTSEVIR